MKRIHQAATQTTTLVVTQPIDFSKLEARFRLVRYELPNTIYIRRDRNDYGRLHNSLRDALRYPYRTYKFDKMSGREKWVVYVLYPKESRPEPILISFLQDAPIHGSEIAFAHLELHVLLKLLQVAYFHGEQQSERFMGQDSCYVFAKLVKKDSSTICLRIDLQEEVRNKQGEVLQEFKVVGHAQLFKRVEEPKGGSHAYFGGKTKGDKVYFIHLKASEVTKTKDPVYEVRTYSGHRTTLLYHDLLRIEESVGKLLYDFIQGFTSYLSSYAIAIQPKVRTFTELPPALKGQTQLPLPLLNPVLVFDNRLQHDHSLQEYIDLFARLRPEQQFLPTEDLSQIHDDAVLIVQDCTKDDFDEGGILQGRKDPYLDLYTRYPSLAKQSINVNLNESDQITTDEYLTYTLPAEDSESFQLKLEVGLCQLYLKDAIIHKRSVKERLPLLPTEYLFIRKARYFSGPYETLLYINGDTLHFINVGDPNGKVQRDELLSRFGVDWEDMYERMLDK